MYVIREVVTCKPGKVCQMVEKFQGMSTIMQEMGQQPLKVLTDVAGGPFWTIVAEAKVERIPLLGMIAVIQTFVYPNAYNDHLVWGSILVLVLTRGPGVFSLDYVIERAVRHRAAKRRSGAR